MHGGPWAQTCVDDTENLWRSLEGKYPFWDSGFSVFYSPVDEAAKVVIVGANPGGGPSSFDVARASSIPAVHDYFTYEYPMATKMKDLFARAGRPDLLQGSLKLNLNFFRSRDAEEWKSAPSPTREAMESHSRRAVVELVERIRPAVVLCEGMATFDSLRDTLCGGSSVSVPIQSPGGRAYARSATRWRGALLGIIHPTGARYSTLTWQRVADALRADLSDV